jgi:MarR family transcriptional regulator, temperature-dependent positive regulator of motility
MRGTKSAPNIATGSRTVVPPVHRVPSHLGRRFNQICVGLLAEVTGPAGLAPIEYAMLVSIEEQPGIDQRGLALRLGVDPVTTGQLIDRLEATGLVDRKVDPEDRRARVLRPSKKGLQLRRRLRPLVIAADGQVTASLTAAERRLFVQFLTRIIEANESYARPGNGRRRPLRMRATKEVNVTRGG